MATNEPLMVANAFWVDYGAMFVNERRYRPKGRQRKNYSLMMSNSEAS